MKKMSIVLVLVSFFVSCPWLFSFPANAQTDNPMCSVLAIQSNDLANVGFDIRAMGEDNSSQADLDSIMNGSITFTGNPQANWSTTFNFSQLKDSSGGRNICNPNS